MTCIRPKIHYRAHGATGVHTGVAIEFEPAAGAIVKTRSGLAKKRLMCNAGVIDAGYRGEIIVLMENLGDQPYTIRKGDKIAQFLEHPFLAGRWQNPNSAKLLGAIKVLARQADPAQRVAVPGSIPDSHNGPVLGKATPLCDPPLYERSKI